MKEQTIKELKDQIQKLQAFKDYVHQRLDEAGIEKEPNGEHSKNGCRIGDRLDIVVNYLNVDLYSESDIERAYKFGERKATFFKKNGSVILPDNYEGIEG